MDNIKSISIEKNSITNINASGNKSIQKFSDKQFGATFSRVLNQINYTTDIILNPKTGNKSVIFPYQRPSNCIVYGRLCSYPNSTNTYWQSLQEEEPFFDYTLIGLRPYETFKINDNYLDLLTTTRNIGEKIVIQILFVEL